MRKKQSVLEKISTVTGAYAGARTGADVAASILYNSGVQSISTIILTDFVLSLLGCGIGAVVGNKGGTIFEKVTDKEEYDYE